MPLIKPNQSPPRAGSAALALDLCDLQQQADLVVAKARRDAAEIIAAARQEAAAIVAAAGERGYHDGMERGLVEGREEGAAAARTEVGAAHEERLSEIAAAWTATLERWEQRFASMLLDAREDVLTFAFAMARKIVLRTPEVDPTVVRAQLAETLSLLCRPSEVTIEVHPDDRPLVDESLPALLEYIAKCEHAHVRESTAITRGGCIVRTAHGAIDATLEKQIDRIAETLLPARPDAEPRAGTDTGTGTDASASRNAGAEPAP